jgi:hypothetical protein
MLRNKRHLKKPEKSMYKENVGAKANLGSEGQPAADDLNI